MSAEIPQDELNRMMAWRVDCVTRLLAMGWPYEAAAEYADNASRSSANVRIAMYEAVTRASDARAFRAECKKLDPNGRTLAQVTEHILAAARKEFQPLSRDNLSVNVDAGRLPRRALDARGPTDGVGRVSFES